MDKILVITNSDFKQLLKQAFESGKTFKEFDGWFETINKTIDQISSMDILSEYELKVFFDIMYDVFGIAMTEKQLNDYFQNLPQEIKDETEKWGVNDTVVKEKIILFFKQTFDRL